MCFSWAFLFSSWALPLVVCADFRLIQDFTLDWLKFLPPWVYNWVIDAVGKAQAYTNCLSPAFPYFKAPEELGFWAEVIEYITHFLVNAWSALSGIVNMNWSH
jgi:hypothetical protein